MSRRLPLFLLIFSVVVLVIGLQSISVLLQPPAISVAERKEIARTLENYPAAKDAYRRSAEISFDLPSKSSVPVWQEAYLTAERLAPAWTTTRRELIRQGFFHWPELTEADRQRVLRETAELMRDPRTFTQLHRPLWHLTRDLEYLRRAAPVNIDSWQELIGLALEVGEFEQYRALRGEAPGIFEQSLKRKIRLRASPEEILNDLLKMERAPETRPVMRLYLHWLSENPPTGLESNPEHLTQFLDYAIGERLPQLGALVHLASPESPLPPPVRARLAVATDNVTVADAIEREFMHPTPQWTSYLLERAIYEANRDDIGKARQRLDQLAAPELQSAPVLAVRAYLAGKRGEKQEAERFYTALEQKFSPETMTDERWGLCNGALCSHENSAVTFARTPRRLTVGVAPGRDQSPPAYVEVFIDDHRIAEGAIDGPTKFDLNIPAGLHRPKLHLVNPRAVDGARLVNLESQTARATPAPRP